MNLPRVARGEQAVIERTFKLGILKKLGNGVGWKKDTTGTRAPVQTSKGVVSKSALALHAMGQPIMSQ